MFISEIEEAWYYNFYDLDVSLIHESNERFASIVSGNINETLDVLFKNVIHEYGLLAKRNPIARFNLERLILTEIKKQIQSVIQLLNSKNHRYGCNGFCLELPRLFG